MMKTNFVIFCLIFQQIKTSHQIDIYDSLENGLNYLVRNQNNVTADILLGVSMAEGQLLEIVFQNNLTKDENSKLNELIRTCCRLRQNLKTIKIYPTRYNALVSVKLINPNLWKTGYFILKVNSLKKIRHYFSGINEYFKVADSGEPSEINSDMCLAEILNSNGVTTKCWNIMDIDKPSFGYHLTHKLLYFTVLERLSEILALPLLIDIDKIFNKICSEILNESEFIEKMKFPDELKDVFIEQVLFCGAQGFTEFLREKWVSNILSWLTENDCFNYSMNHKNANCTNHLKGLAIGILALFGKITYTNY